MGRFRRILLVDPPLVSFPWFFPEAYEKPREASPLRERKRPVSPGEFYENGPFHFEIYTPLPSRILDGSATMLPPRMVAPITKPAPINTRFLMMYWPSSVVS